MDIFKGKGSRTQGGTEHINRKGERKQPTTGQERTRSKHFAPFLFVSEAVRKGKKANPQSQENKTKSRKAGKAGSQAGEQAKAGQEDKRRKRKAKHAASL